MASPQSPAPGAPTVFTTGNFLVSIDGIAANAAFSEVSGLEAAIEVIDYRSGDSSENSPRKLPGLNRYSSVTLRRGLTSDQTLWNWIDNGLKGTVQRADIMITLRDAADNPVWRWHLKDAWPCRWSGPVLSAGSPEVAIETLEICHERLDVA
jgi:phage tail-like protein